MPSAAWSSPRRASAWRGCREAPSHIDNPVSVAPGFRIGNVHVMAGVPAIFQAMLDNVCRRCEPAPSCCRRTVHCPFGEGVIGGPLAEIQKAHPDTIIGSYPKYRTASSGPSWSCAPATPAVLEAARSDVEAMVARLSKPA